MSDVVTGEAVALDVRVAELPVRAVALLIDLVVQYVAIFAMIFVVGTTAVLGDSALASALIILLLVLVIVGYPVIFETLSRGRTLGKLALGLRVVGEDGSPERFRQALFRGLAGFAEIWVFQGAPALISSLISQKGKRLGDIFAGTIVISERVAVRARPLPMVPPGLENYARSLELSALPNDVANTARQYLTRWHDLSPAARHQMGTRIASGVAAYVSPPPPPGVPPDAYLAAVIAERRRRHEARLMGQLAARRRGSYGQSAAVPPPAVPYGPAGPAPTPAPSVSGDFAPPA